MADKREEAKNAPRRGAFTRSTVENPAAPNVPQETPATEDKDAQGKLVPANIGDPTPMPPQPEKATGPTGDQPAKTGDYLDPKEVKPNPNPEVHPNQRQPESVLPRADLRPGTDHQVYPEHYLGTTPTDPDLRRNADPAKDTQESQTAEMARRRDATSPQKVPMDQVNPEVVERRRAANAQPEAPDAPKDTGGLTSLEDGKEYTVRAGGSTAWWWRRKYDGLPTVRVEGRFHDVMGFHANDRMAQGHYLIDGLRQRVDLLPAGHPVARDWDRSVYVATLFGIRELVHASEVETAHS